MQRPRGVPGPASTVHACATLVCTRLLVTSVHARLRLSPPPAQGCPLARALWGGRGTMSAVLCDRTRVSSSRGSGAFCDTHHKCTPLNRGPQPVFPPSQGTALDIQHTIPVRFALFAANNHHVTGWITRHRLLLTGAWSPHHTGGNICIARIPCARKCDWHHLARLSHGDVTRIACNCSCAGTPTLSDRLTASYSSVAACNLAPAHGACSNVCPPLPSASQSERSLVTGFTVLCSAQQQAAGSRQQAASSRQQAASDGALISA